jgi:hypothetical protein
MTGSAPGDIRVDRRHGKVPEKRMDTGAVLETADNLMQPEIQIRLSVQIQDSVK